MSTKRKSLENTYLDPDAYTMLCEYAELHKLTKKEAASQLIRAALSEVIAEVLTEETLDMLYDTYQSSRIKDHPDVNIGPNLKSAVEKFYNVKFPYFNQMLDYYKKKRVENVSPKMP